MILSLAPMEGITGSVFRRVHAECFGALDRYYTPFVAPPRTGSEFGKKAMKELDPERNKGIDVVPPAAWQERRRVRVGGAALGRHGVLRGEPEPWVPLWYGLQ